MFSPETSRHRARRTQVLCLDRAFGEALEPRHLLSHGPAPGAHAEVSDAARVHRTPSRTLQWADAMVYEPAGLQPGRSYPLAVVFTPDGKLNRTLGNWKSVADRLGWIVYASKDFNDAAVATDVEPIASTIRSHVAAALGTLPADPGRVVLAGFSGGGFMAEYLDATTPGLTSALVIDANGLYSYGPQPDYPLPAGSGRPAVFLASHTDGQFGPPTLTERALYQTQGWSTQLLSYSGGHVDAPKADYLAAATFIAHTPGWHA